MDKSKGRLDYIDIAKGIGILLVVMGHFHMPATISWWIFSFHMPLFIILSGMVFNGTLKNIKSLLVCFLFAAVVSSTINLILNPSVITLKSVVLGILGGGAAPRYLVELTPALWFLTALVFIEILFVIVHRLGKNVQLLAFILFPAIGFILSRYKTNGYIPWNVDVALLLYPFFVLGCKIKSSNIIERIEENSSKVQLAVISMLMLISLDRLKILNGGVNIFRCEYGNDIFLYYINGIIGTFGIILFSVIFAKNRLAKNYISFVGRHTLIIMCFHQLLIQPVIYIFDKYNIGTGVDALIKFFGSVLIIVILTGISILINKYIPWAVGRRKQP